MKRTCISIVAGATTTVSFIGSIELELNRTIGISSIFPRVVIYGHLGRTASSPVTLVAQNFSSSQTDTFAGSQVEFIQKAKVVKNAVLPAMHCGVVGPDP